jgi:hypothetical protein
LLAVGGAAQAEKDAGHYARDCSDSAALKLHFELLVWDFLKAVPPKAPESIARRSNNAARCNWLRQTDASLTCRT